MENDKFKVIESENVDILTPFPASQYGKIYGWMKCFRNLVETDETPFNKADFTAHISRQMPNIPTYGVVDKNGKLKRKQAFPLVGMITFEQVSPYNGYFHVASSFKAWGSRLMDEAAGKVVEDIFSIIPSLTRVSVWINEHNRPAISLARRVGFSKDGVLKDMIVQGGQPRTLIHMGLTRREWENDLCHKQYCQPSESVEPLPVPLEAEENKSNLVSLELQKT